MQNHSGAEVESLTSYLCVIHWKGRLSILTIGWGRWRGDGADREGKIGTGEVIERVKVKKEGEVQNTGETDREREQKRGEDSYTEGREKEAYGRRGG